MNIKVFGGRFLLVENFRKDGGSAGKSICLPWKFSVGCPMTGRKKKAKKKGF